MSQVGHTRRGWGRLPPYLEPVNEGSSRLRYRRKVPAMVTAVLGNQFCHSFPAGTTVEQAEDSH